MKISMQQARRHACWRGLVLSMGCALASSSWAQQTTLYDPQPPANSAYVRVLVGSGGKPADVSVDQRPRLRNLEVGTPSEYMVLTAGQHELAVKSGNQQVAVKITAEATRSLTVLLPEVTSQAKPTVIEDKTNSNKLKAIISAYHLGGTSPIDVWTTNGQIQVFNALAPLSSASLVVNPVKLDYMVTAVGQKTALADAQLIMKPGEAYSIVVSRDAAGQVSTRAFTNAIERLQSK